MQRYFVQAVSIRLVLLENASLPFFFGQPHLSDSYSGAATVITLYNLNGSFCSTFPKKDYIRVVVKYNVLCFDQAL